MTKDEALKPWWWPKITDTVWCQSVREECEEARDMTDEDIRDEYADGQKYDTLWDHLGDAYEDYERVADALAAKEAECKELRELLKEAGPHIQACAGLYVGDYRQQEADELLNFLTRIDAALKEQP